jgi:hypothetical protein
MVTAELSVAILAALLLLVSLCWGISLVLMQMKLIDAASEMARQAARGDRAGVAEAQRQAPHRASIDIHVGTLTSVTISFAADPLGRWLPAVVLSARSVVVTEPGVGT